MPCPSLAPEVGHSPASAHARVSGKQARALAQEQRECWPQRSEAAGKASFVFPQAVHRWDLRKQALTGHP